MGETLQPVTPRFCRSLRLARGPACGVLPVAEACHDRAHSLPLHPRLTEGDQDRVVAVPAAALG